MSAEICRSQFFLSPTLLSLEDSLCVIGSTGNWGWQSPPHPPTRTLDGILLQTDNKQRGDAASSQGLQLQGPSAFPYPSIPHPELRAQFSRPSSSLPYREVAPTPHSALKP